MSGLYDQLKEKALVLFGEADLLEQVVTVKARVLSTEEAIGNPEADDFPLQKGKERLMQATFGEGVGQAFTDQFGDFEGTLKEVLEMSLENNFRRAVFIATLNAALHHMGKAPGTIHCRDEEPVECAKQLVAYLQEKYPGAKIGQVGLQPRMLEAVSKAFSVRLLDLDPGNIGTKKFGVLVEGPDATAEVMDWADVMLVTGSTVANGTIEKFMGDKPVVLYGTTVAGAAALMGWERFCACGH
jgi:uncharacterized protein (DUF4213/DUF364 family)